MTEGICAIMRKGGAFEGIRGLWREAFGVCAGVCYRVGGVCGGMYGGLYGLTLPELVRLAEDRAAWRRSGHEVAYTPG